MADFCFCSACGADLRGAVIPVESRHLYGNRQLCEHGCGGEVHYSRVLGIYDMKSDRTVSWRCPHCGHEEARRG